MIGLSALLTSCITPAASWPTAASRRSRDARFLQREQLLGALLDHPLESLGFRRDALVQLGGAPHLLLELAREPRPLRDVALDGDRAADLPRLVAERVRVHLDHGRPGLALAAADGEGLAAHALAA